MASLRDGCGFFEADEPNILDASETCEGAERRDQPVHGDRPEEAMDLGAGCDGVILS